MNLYSTLNNNPKSNEYSTIYNFLNRSKEDVPKKNIHEENIHEENIPEHEENIPEPEENIHEENIPEPEENLYQEVYYPLPPDNLVNFPYLSDVSTILKNKNKRLHEIIGTYVKAKIDNDKLFSRSDNLCKFHLATMLKRDYYWRILYMLQYYKTKNPELTLDSLVPNLKLGNLLRDDEKREEANLFPLEPSTYGGKTKSRKTKSRKTKRHFIKNKKQGRRSRRM